MRQLYVHGYACVSVCVCVYIYIFIYLLNMLVCVYTHNSVTIQRSKDYKFHWEISNKGTNRE
jgi:hypothetical protein